MPTSFESLHEETRPLAMLAEPAQHRPSGVTTFISALALLLPALIVVLS